MLTNTVDLNFSHVDRCCTARVLIMRGEFIVRHYSQSKTRLIPPSVYQLSDFTFTSSAQVMFYLKELRRKKKGELLKHL